MKVRRIVGEKGQVVIPKIIRDHPGIKPGNEVVMEVRGKEL
ncbi:MAG: AbrB/MazE/SpoVT family DNA-binding domain-containing protein [Archaeoglobaceae archaeon]